jgi:hypothetical protein
MASPDVDRYAKQQISLSLSLFCLEQSKFILLKDVSWHFVERRFLASEQQMKRFLLNYPTPFQIQ